MRAWFALVALAAALLPAAAPAQSIKLEVVSSRPELVTGRTALVRVTGTAERPPAYASNDTLITPMVADGKGGWLGLIPELNEGAENKLFALPNFHSPGPETGIKVLTHPVNATLFAGPQTMPFRCDNAAHGLAAPQDEACTTTEDIAYYYRSTAGGWRVMNPTGPRPADVADTNTTEGNTVPLIVRVEKGVANRAAYAIAILHDPAQPMPSPGNHSPGWNGRLVYAFGGGVGYDGHAMGTAIGFLDPTQGYVGGENAGLYEAIIRDGYAIAGASLNVTGATANDVVQAETLEKVKEQFIKRFGPPEQTIGVGKDGGALPIYLIAQNYPGLIDGVLAINGYADAMELQTEANDCALFAHYFATTKVAWTDDQKRYATGLTTLCATYPHGAPDACPAPGPCTLQENLVNVVGRDPKTGRARNPWDNVGVQYGVQALNVGLISEEQFLDLNRKIGGLTSDGGFQAERNTGDVDTIRRAYATGRVLTGGDGLASSAIVNVRLYPFGSCNDPPCPPDPATVPAGRGDRTLAIRTRIEYATTSPGNYAELVIADDGKAGGPDGSTARVLGNALFFLDKWLTDADANPAVGTRPERIVTYRPQQLRDTCLLKGDVFTDKRSCNAFVPVALGVRVVAGGPRSDDVLKCVLKPIARDDYSPLASADFTDRLRALFPQGVCDYSQPGVGQVPLQGTWLTYDADGTLSVSALP